MSFNSPTEDIGRVKGSGIAFILQRIKTMGLETEQALLSRLTPSEQTIFQTAMPIAWIELKAASSIYAQAAALIYPKEKNAVKAVAREVAISDLTGIYKIMLRFATIPMIMEKASQLWRVNHSKGEARVQKETNRDAGAFIVEKYPGLTTVYRDVTTGYIQGVLELTERKNILVRFDDQNPNAWCWHVFWK